jgi:membrane protein DedA with SNARE-associated domain
MSNLAHLITAYGGWVVAAAVGLENVGVPVSGETILISAAVHAGATHRLRILTVVIAGATGAIMGDNLGS